MNTLQRIGIRLMQFDDVQRYIIRDVSWARRYLLSFTVMSVLYLIVLTGGNFVDRLRHHEPIWVGIVNLLASVTVGFLFVFLYRCISATLKKIEQRATTCRQETSKMMDLVTDSNVKDAPRAFGPN